jgi:hypothetical protein
MCLCDCSAYSERKFRSQRAQQELLRNCPSVTNHRQNQLRIAQVLAERALPTTLATGRRH